MSNLDILASLNPVACAAAQKVADAGGVLTSGRRGVDAQASAMAADTVLDRNFIQNTYRHPLCPVAQALVDCAAQNPTANQATLETLFLGVMAGFPDVELEKLSAHLGGNAFDIQPDDALVPICKQVVADHVSAGGQGLFLQQEGSLRRFHVQLS